MCATNRYLTIPRPMLNEIIRHLASQLPNEGCGLLAVRSMHCVEIVAERFFTGTNIDASPTRFTMDPAEVIEAFRTMRMAGIELGAIVHSHPASPASPSRTDRAEAYYPDAFHMIVSFADPEPDVRLWNIFDGHCVPNPCEIPLKVFETHQHRANSS